MPDEQATLLDLYKQLDTEASAKFLDVTPRKMEKMRQFGDGPKFVRVSKKCVRYRVKDLIEYQELHLQSNTIQGAA